MSTLAISTRTLVRDALMQGFENLKTGGEARVKEFAVSPRWLHETQTTRANTYCLVVTDETRVGDTLLSDRYDMTVVLVIYAYDQKDPRARLDAMVEDALAVMTQRADGLRAAHTIIQMTVSEITTDEGSTEAGPWAQAVLRWTASHHRPAVAA